jgi:hypothetical protein
MTQAAILHGSQARDAYWLHGDCQANLVPIQAQEQSARPPVHYCPLLLESVGRGRRTAHCRNLLGDSPRVVHMVPCAAAPLLLPFTVRPSFEVVCPSSPHLVHSHSFGATPSHSLIHPRIPNIVQRRTLTLDDPYDTDSAHF